MNVVVMVGMPGSGKSTHARNNFSDKIVISSDKYIEEYAQNRGITYAEAFCHYVSTANKKYDVDMNNMFRNPQPAGYLIDRTNLSVAARKKVYSKIPRNATITVVNMLIDNHTLRERNEERKAIGRDIPAHVMTSMLESYVQPDYKEDFRIIDILEIR